MKKTLSIILFLIFVISMSACSAPDNNKVNKNEPDTKIENIEQKTENIESTSEVESTERQTTKKEDKKIDYSAKLGKLVNINNITSITQLVEEMEKESKGIVNYLIGENNKIITEINSYEIYKQNIDRLDAHYKNIIDTNYNLGIRLREYAAKYVLLIMDSDDSMRNKYDFLDDVYDDVYDSLDEMEYIYDLVNDLEDKFYDGIVKDGEKIDDFDKWYKISSDEYNRWLKTHSKVFEEWRSTRSDINVFIFDVRNEAFENDIDGINKDIEKFMEKIEYLKNKL